MNSNNHHRQNNNHSTHKYNHQTGEYFIDSHGLILRVFVFTFFIIYVCTMVYAHEIIGGLERFLPSPCLS